MSAEDRPAGAGELLARLAFTRGNSNVSVEAVELVPQLDIVNDLRSKNASRFLEAVHQFVHAEAGPNTDIVCGCSGQLLSWNEFEQYPEGAWFYPASSWVAKSAQCLLIAVNVDHEGRVDHILCPFWPRLKRPLTKADLLQSPSWLALQDLKTTDKQKTAQQLLEFVSSAPMGGVPAILDLERVDASAGEADWVDAVTHRLNTLYRSVRDTIFFYKKCKKPILVPTINAIADIIRYSNEKELNCYVLEKTPPPGSVLSMETKINIVCAPLLYWTQSMTVREHSGSYIELWMKIFDEFDNYFAAKSKLDEACTKSKSKDGSTQKKLKEKRPARGSHLTARDVFLCRQIVDILKLLLEKMSNRNGFEGNLLQGRITNFAQHLANHTSMTAFQVSSGWYGSTARTPGAATLSLDGGGQRSYFAARVLQVLQRLCKTPLSQIFGRVWCTPSSLLPALAVATSDMSRLNAVVNELVEKCDMLFGDYQISEDDAKRIVDQVIGKDGFNLEVPIDVVFFDSAHRISDVRTIEAGMSLKSDEHKTALELVYACIMRTAPCVEASAGTCRNPATALMGMGQRHQPQQRESDSGGDGGANVERHEGRVQGRLRRSIGGSNDSGSQCDMSQSGKSGNGDESSERDDSSRSGHAIGDDDSHSGRVQGRQRRTIDAGPSNGYSSHHDLPQSSSGGNGSTQSTSQAGVVGQDRLSELESGDEEDDALELWEDVGTSSMTYDRHHQNKMPQPDLSQSFNSAVSMGSLSGSFETALPRLITIGSGVRPLPDGCSPFHSTEDVATTLLQTLYTSISNRKRCYQRLQFKLVNPFLPHLLNVPFLGGPDNGYVTTRRKKLFSDEWSGSGSDELLMERLWLVVELFLEGNEGAVKRVSEALHSWCGI